MFPAPAQLNFRRAPTVVQFNDAVHSFLTNARTPEEINTFWKSVNGQKVNLQVLEYLPPKIKNKLLGNYSATFWADHRMAFAILMRAYEQVDHPSGRLFTTDTIQIQQDIDVLTIHHAIGELSQMNLSQGIMNFSKVILISDFFYNDIDDIGMLEILFEQFL